MRVPKELPFEQVNALALGQYPPLLFSWFPNGTLVDGQKEFAIGDLAGTAGGKDGGSVKVNIRSGWWAEMNGGEPKGKDPISLYAWAFCGGDRVRACKEMGASLGVPGCNPPKGAEVVPFPVKNPPRTPPKEDWQPCDPPDNAEPANTKGWDHVFIYRDRAGKLLRYVLRNDAKGDEPKKILPQTYGTLNGKTGWHYKQPASPRSLYGLERLDNAPVILQEGELKTDLVQALLPGYACLSLTGGTGGRNHNDLAPLAGRHVLLVPDNDAGGRDTMRGIARQMRAMGCTVQLIDLTGQPDKWDLGDAVKEGVDAAKLEAFLKERARDELPDPESGDDLEGDDSGEWEEEAPNGKPRDGIIPLGQDDNSLFWYLSVSGGRVSSLSAAQHTDMQLMGLASFDWWRTFPQFEKGDCDVDWKKAANFFMDIGRRMPPYNPDKLRGVGAWVDRHLETGVERCVLHQGENLVVDGIAQAGLRLEGSRYIYERRLSLAQTIAPPITNVEARKLADIIRSMPWEKPIFGTLMAGWLAVAPICGALRWRPAIWVTGGSGAGKTTLDTNIVAPILEGVSLRLQSISTEAGIRQTLKNNAISVIFDEAEAEGLTDKQRMQLVLHLVRASTSEGGASIVKGTQSQMGARVYHMRSCFMFMSINVAMNNKADESRVTVLALETPPPGDVIVQARYDALMDRIAALVTPEFCAGFVARSVRLMPIIRDNAITFAKAVSAKLGSARIGDQIGTLCAGAYSQHCDKRISLEEARAWVDAQDWEDATSADAITDEQRLVNLLLARRLTVKSIKTGNCDRTVGELIAAADGKDKDDFPPGPAEMALKQVGLMHGKGGVWVANNHPALAEYLKDTPWASSESWRRALKRYPGAQSSVAQLYFAGVYSRATFIPLDLPEPEIL